ncbi:DNA-binding MarR family transcriptional regulator [Kineosphaera limosa]|uniref:Putative MarR family transcriptional regulator n=1 Tax=Kineosphaera limosa NBRC 100340 TaxID=1184609 RepID=K6WFA8_9MICO|nr:MarR family transcriptional regulator [Kineosphaera limosa]NYD99079.1 DNA-binding MarR family transcriptional regulator [Kineosphaera limosa]GAB97980.1 putative MarR family transcriptional regulator [Kineosphaera limosa NBRC 100340]
MPKDLDSLASDLVVSSAKLVRLVRYRTNTGQAQGADSTATWRALAILSDRGPLRVTEFAELDQLTQPSATAILRRLRGEGAVHSAPDPRDGRASLVSLTPAGEARLSRLRRAGATAVAPLLADLSDEERALLRRASDLLDEVTRRDPLISSSRKDTQ